MGNRRQFDEIQAGKFICIQVELARKIREEVRQVIPIRPGDFSDADFLAEQAVVNRAADEYFTAVHACSDKITGQIRPISLV